MNLADKRIQKAIIEIAETSESAAVVEACKLVIQDHLDHGDTEISGAREVILTALESLKQAKQLTHKRTIVSLETWLISKQKELKLEKLGSGDRDDFIRGQLQMVETVLRKLDTAKNG